MEKIFFSQFTLKYKVLLFNFEVQSAFRGIRDRQTHSDQKVRRVVSAGQAKCKK